MSAHRRPLVALLSSTAFEGHRLYEQRLAEELARDHDVLFVQPPTAVWTRRDGLRAGRGPVRAPRGVRVVTPWVPPASRRRGLHRLNAPVVALTLLAACLRDGRRPRAVVTAQDVTGPLARAARALGARTAFLVKDDYVAGAGLVGVPAARLRAGRERSLDLADEVVVVSPRLLRLAAERGRTAHLVPAGAPEPVAAEGAARAVAEGSAPGPAPGPAPEGERPFAVFLGMVSDRLDLGWLEELVRTGTDLVVVGPRQPTFTQDAAWQRLVADPRVRWLGPREAGEVAGVLARARVGVMPYTLSEFNRASFPLKVLEYLAAGLPVVSSRLDAVEWLDAPGVRVVDDAAGFAAAVAELVAAGPSARGAGERRAFAAGHTWRERGRRWRELLGLDAPAAGGPAAGEPAAGARA
ncbi:glycosyltransferase [Kineococcus sp. SYSU DK005]|uniref:glycosyltransferase n=1 Tax=Kineococcus sp. SYSU DK005 TaxID=3383126 RepID=UPI003D7C8A44